MAAIGFDTYYGDNPWSGIGTKTRAWYVPDLLDIFRRRSIFRNFVPQKVNLAAQSTDTMYFTLLYDLETTEDSIGLRDLWLPALHTDSAKITITMQHQAGKVALHKYDELITYWRKAGMEGLRRIIRGLLAVQMTDTLDKLARNAFLGGPFALYAGDASNDGFDDLDSTSDDIFKINMLEKIWLGLSYRNAPMAQSPEGPTGSVVVLTTPGVIYDIRAASSTDWISLQEYTTNIVRLPYEVGSVYGCRFLQHPALTLWNNGVLTDTEHILAAVSPGDGAYATVDEVYAPGQSGATAYITVGDVTKFSVNDIVTICRTRSSAYGVTNAPDYTKETTFYRRIVNIDTDNNRLSFDMPILSDSYATEVTANSGIYGYVMKGKHIHASVCLGGPNGVVAGVGQPPEVHVPPTVDDIMGMFRFSWDAYLKYQRFRPELYETVYSLGATRVKGAVAYGG
jgi:N4-gp56 family major capsid protein